MWLTISVWMLLSDVTGGEDWPQFRGPNRTGVSSETGLLAEWPEGGPPRQWLYEEAGLGYSGFSVVGDRLYTLGARGDHEYLITLDVASGSEVWAVEVGDRYENSWGDGPRSTPTVDGENVYALAARGNLVAVRRRDGELLWSKSLPDLGGSIPNWGYTESVLIDGDLVLCTPGGDQGTVAALDKFEGKVVWQSSAVTDDAQYSSLVAGDHNGVRQLVQLSERRFFGVAAGDGRLLWSVPFPGSVAVVPTPIVWEDLVYATSGYGAGCKLVRLGSEFAADELYSNKIMKNHHGGVVLIDEHVYGYSDGRGWTCQNFLNGNSVWNERRALGKGSLTAAEGRLYCFEEGEGTVVLADASPNGWRERGRFQLDPLSTQRASSGGIWVHPVIANGRLYVRDQELLYCYDIRQQ